MVTSIDPPVGTVAPVNVTIYTCAVADSATETAPEIAITPASSSFIVPDTLGVPIVAKVDVEVVNAILNT